MAPWTRLSPGSGIARSNLDALAEGNRGGPWSLPVHSRAHLSMLLTQRPKTCPSPQARPGRRAARFVHERGRGQLAQLRGPPVGRREVLGEQQFRPKHPSPRLAPRHRVKGAPSHSEPPAPASTTTTAKPLLPGHSVQEPGTTGPPGACRVENIPQPLPSPAQGHAPLCLGRAGLPKAVVEVRIRAGKASRQGLWNPANPLGVRRREVAMLGERALIFLCSIEVLGGQGIPTSSRIPPAVHLAVAL